MDIDKIIEILQEAKEHGFDGKDTVLVKRENNDSLIPSVIVGKVTDAYYTRDKVYIEYGTL